MFCTSASPPRTCPLSTALHSNVFSRTCALLCGPRCTHRMCTHTLSPALPETSLNAFTILPAEKRVSDTGAQSSYSTCAHVVVRSWRAWERHNNILSATNGKREPMIHQSMIPPLFEVVQIHVHVHCISIATKSRRGTFERFGGLPQCVRCNFALLLFVLLSESLRRKVTVFLSIRLEPHEPR